jgi:hypothetical protein
MRDPRPRKIVRPRTLYLVGGGGSAIFLALLAAARAVSQVSNLRNVLVFGGLFVALAAVAFLLVRVQRFELYADQMRIYTGIRPHSFKLEHLAALKYVDAGPRGPWLALVGADGTELFRSRAWAWAPAQICDLADYAHLSYIHREVEAQSQS